MSLAPESMVAPAPPLLAAYSGQVVHLSGDGMTFDAGAGEWWPNLPDRFNDHANAAY
ncbi:hypothetical protein [Kitasatospora sp. NPDC096204]|uniref:hypothetical protein n=1 Tax=Kitasatospora sp. NPDC096204 TaxID=3364094 RepID=UPI0038172C0F